jgi:ribosomal protein S18 acetylase RimI-like enzyme
MSGLTAGLSFRRAGSADAAVIRSITRQAYSKWTGLIGREPLPMTFDYDALVLKHRIELALLAGDVAGLIVLVELPGHFLIENLAVAPDCQRLGVGSALLVHAESAAIGAGLREMRLYTNQKFAANISYYQKRGFSVTGEEPFNGGILVHMAKSLA